MEGNDLTSTQQALTWCDTGCGRNTGHQAYRNESDAAPRDFQLGLQGHGVLLLAPARVRTPLEERVPAHTRSSSGSTRATLGWPTEPPISRTTQHSTVLPA